MNFHISVFVCVLLLSEEPHRPKMKFVNPLTSCRQKKNFPNILNYCQTHKHSHTHTSMQGPATRQTAISQTYEILHRQTCYKVYYKVP